MLSRFTLNRGVSLVAYSKSGYADRPRRSCSLFLFLVITMQLSDMAISSTQVSCNKLQLNVLQVCAAAVGLMGDLCRALGVKVLPYCDETMVMLLENLSVCICAYPVNIRTAGCLTHTLI